MKPYYEDTVHGITIYHGDCREVVQDMPSDCVDLLLTDPPYGKNFQSNRRELKFEKIVGDDGSLDVTDALLDCLNCLRRGRHVYVFGKLDLSRLPLCQPVELIWDKGIIGMGNLESPWGSSHEPITFAVYEISKANRDKDYGRLAARMRKGSILRVQRNQSGQVKNHPTEKPVMLLRQLIESSSIMGETVFDPFMGSGSTLVAAQLEGRGAIGIEIEEKNCETAAKRLRGYNE